MTDITREEVEALASAKERQLANGPERTSKLLREEMALAAAEDLKDLQSELDEEEAEERKLFIVITALRAFAKSMDAEPVVPPGWRLVPVEPTDEMLDWRYATRALCEDGDQEAMRDLIRAAIAASPQPQPTERVSG